MKLCFITAKLPVPASGSAIRNYLEIKYLRKAGWIISILYAGRAISTGEKNRCRKALDCQIRFLTIPTLSPIQKAGIAIHGLIPFVERFRKNTVLSEYTDFINSHNLVHLAELEAYSLIEPVRRRIRVPIIMDAHNVHVRSLSAEIDRLPTIVRMVARPFLAWYGEYEKSAIWNVDRLLACSETDAAYFRNVIPKDRCSVIPNAVDIPAKRILADTDPHAVLFMGSLGYAPNETGLLRYIRSIHPLVLDRLPETVLHVIGGYASRKLSAVMRRTRNVTYHGFVDDTSSYITTATVCICPIYTGSGTRIKILDYMSYGKAVVSTPKGAEGIRQNNSIIIANSDKKFALSVVSLLLNKKLCNKLGLNAYDTVSTYYSALKELSKLDNLYRSLIT